MRILENPFLVKKVLKGMCRSKKARIKKKWLKNDRNYKTVPDDQCIVTRNGVIICHPLTADRLRRELGNPGHCQSSASGK